MNKLTLIINTPQRGDDLKTAAHPRRRPRRLGRRRTQDGIKIFDLGYRLSGESYIDLPFVDPNRTDPATFNAASAGIPFAALPATSTHFNTLASEVFEVPLGQWKTNYRQIDDDYTDNLGVFAGEITVNFKGNNYVLSAITSEDVWSEGVFTPNLADVDSSFTVTPTNQTLSRTIGTSSSFKWTSTYDYAADEVTFVPSTNMDVYLMPTFLLNQFFTLLDLAEQTYEIMCYHHVVWPRVTQIDPLHEYYAPNYVGSTLYSGATWSAALSSTSNTQQYQAAYKVAEMFKDFHPHYASRATGPATTWTESSITTADYQDAAYFPVPPTTPTAPEANGLTWIFSVPTPPNGTLLGVVKKGGVFHYCWQDA